MLIGVGVKRAVSFLITAIFRARSNTSPEIEARERLLEVSGERRATRRMAGGWPGHATAWRLGHYVKCHSLEVQSDKCEPRRCLFWAPPATWSYPGADTDRAEFFYRLWGNKGRFSLQEDALQEGTRSWASLQNHLRSRSGVNGTSRGREAGGLARCLGLTPHPPGDPGSATQPPAPSFSSPVTWGVITPFPSNVWGISSDPARNHPTVTSDRLLH